MNKRSFKNQTIWIIGASSGIGAALAKQLNEHGATLVLSARSEDKLKSLNKDLGGNHHVVPVDVSKHKAVKDAAKTAFELSGNRIDRIVHLAALYEPTAIADMKVTNMSKTIDVNLKGAYHVIDAVLPLLEKQPFAQLALCGSVAGYRGLPNGQPYSATKAAVMSLAESLRIEHQDKGIDIRLISPGFVETPLTDKNDFDMPMMIKPEEAANYIADGLLGRSYEIHFPKKFTWIMKIIKLMPNFIYHPMGRTIRDRRNS